MGICGARRHDHTILVGRVGRYVPGELHGLWRHQDTYGPLPVDALPPNPFGLYDMLGGVAQWMADCWFPNYRGSPAVATPREVKACQKRVLRGGSFGSPHDEITVTYRGNYDAPVRYIANGFRVARDID
jgi:formylglycine-generating enzyme required for sulfatase activity